MSKTEKPATSVTTGVVRLSYVNLWVPTSMEENQQKKYNTAILIDKKDKSTVAKVKAAIAAAEVLGKEKFGKKWIPAKLKPCLKDGDVDKPDDENYAGHYFLNAKSTTQPIMVNRKMEKIIDQDEIYSGVYAYVSLNFYPYDNVSIGVGAGLGNIMKAKDGEAFSGHSTPEDDFAELLDSTEDANDLM